jgi:hypothetical protein
MKKNISIGWFICLLLLSQLTLTAQHAKDSNTLNDYYLDFSVPDLGAFTLLNIKPGNVSNPGNTKELAASLMDLAGGGSKITPGLAIDWSPLQTFKLVHSPSDYAKYYLLNNIQLSLGTVGDSSGTKLGLGFKWTFIDKSDPLLDKKYSSQLISLHDDIYVQNTINLHDFNLATDQFLDGVFKVSRHLNVENTAIYKTIVDMLDARKKSTIEKDFNQNSNDIIKAINELITENHSNKTKLLTDEEKGKIIMFCTQIKTINNAHDEYVKNYSEGFKKLKKEWLNSHWNATVVTAGAGWVMNSADNKWSGLKTQTFKSFLNGRFWTGNPSQITAMVSFGIPKDSTNTDSTVKSQFFIGGRFLIGNANNRFSIDIGFNNNFTKNSSFNRQVLTTNLGFEFKITDGYFLELAAGLSGPLSNFLKAASIVGLGSFKYAFHKKTRFDIPNTDTKGN